MMPEHRAFTVFKAPETDADPPIRRHKGDPVMRLETQLWAGDEMVWALPAALAFPALDLLFDQTRDWTIAGEDLTHAVGLVFCHHDAPISRIRALAQDLAAHGKTLFARDRDCRFLESGDLVAYEVLESFDHLGGDTERYRRERLRATGCQPFDMVLTRGRLHALTGLAHDLRQSPGSLPRRQLKRLAQRLHAGGPHDRKFLETLKRLTDEHGDFWDERLAGCGKDFGAALWLHLDALYDYLMAEKPVVRGVGNAA